MSDLQQFFGNNTTEGMNDLLIRRFPQVNFSYYRDPPSSIGGYQRSALNSEFESTLKVSYGFGGGIMNVGAATIVGAYDFAGSLWTGNW